jgi:hypothetical protein
LRREQQAEPESAVRRDHVPFDVLQPSLRNGKKGLDPEQYQEQLQLHEVPQWKKKAGDAMVPLLGAGDAMVPLLGAGDAMVPLLGAGNALVPLLGAGDALVPLLGAGDALVPLLGAGDAMVPLLDAGNALVPLLGAALRVQKSRLYPPLLPQLSLLLRRPLLPLARCSAQAHSPPLQLPSIQDWPHQQHVQERLLLLTQLLLPH